jgi:hypothetical protein
MKFVDCVIQAFILVMTLIVINMLMDVFTKMEFAQVALLLSLTAKTKLVTLKVA